MEQKFNKIIIIGDAGRGKSTLAAKLSEKLHVPYYSTDDFYFEIKFSKPREKQKALEDISKVYLAEKWIVEGTTQWLLRPGFDLAGTIIYLQYNNILAQWLSLIKRSLVRVMRKEERLIDVLKLMRHVLYKRYGLGYKKGVMTHPQVIAPYKNKIVVLSSFNDINNFVENL